jgi:hypothetical protein
MAAAPCGVVWKILATDWYSPPTDQSAKFKPLTLYSSLKDIIQIATYK